MHSTSKVPESFLDHLQSPVVEQTQNYGTKPQKPTMKRIATRKMKRKKGKR
jgi:hypothetical protein